MVRKAKITPAYVNLDADEVSSIVLATTGSIKNKSVDPRKLVGTIHIKKYLSDVKINGKIETWISILKKLSPTEEGQSAPELTSDEVDALEQCKKMTKEYLEEEASTTLKQKVADSTDENKNLKSIASSMKFKFSRHAYEVVTHVINLMLREMIVFTCDSCVGQKNKLTKASHVPWAELQSKLLSGVYMNTKAVFDAIHVKPETPVEVEVEAVDASEDVVVEEVATEEDVTEDAPSSEDDAVDVAKVTKPRLSQYISNTFKEITSRDERFKGLLLGKEVTALFNDIIFQVLDRYANIIKSLLQTANSKTVNERIAVIATKIILQDHVYATDAYVSVVLDVLQARLDEIKTSGAQGDVEEEEVEPATPAPVAPVAPVAKEKKSKK